MSNTYKTKPSRLKHEPWDKDSIGFWAKRPNNDYDSYVRLQVPTTKAKKRKEKDTEYHWMHTPNWFVHQFMVKPARRASKQWERDLQKLGVTQWFMNQYEEKFQVIEEIDWYDFDKKGRIYYW